VHRIDNARKNAIVVLERAGLKMAETTNLSIRIERGLKNEADQVFSELGMNLTTAITVFIRQAVRQKRIPFEVTLNNNQNVTLQDALIASEKIWQTSIENGTDKLTMDDIDAEIMAARRERKQIRVEA
jgi:DNA-damage-inducible protein J